MPYIWNLRRGDVLRIGPVTMRITEAHSAHGGGQGASLKAVFEDPTGCSVEVVRHHGRKATAQPRPADDDEPTEA